MTRGPRGPRSAAAPVAAPPADNRVEESAVDDPKVQELYPIMAGLIDEMGGLCRTNAVLEDPRVVEIRKEFPKTPAFKISKIIGDQPSYFTLLDGAAYVATATGYDNGYLDLDGGLTQKGTKYLEEQKNLRLKNREEVAGKPVANGREIVAAPAKGQGKGSKSVQSDLIAVARNISNILRVGNDMRAFEAEVKQARQLMQERLRAQGTERAIVAAPARTETRAPKTNAALGAKQPFRNLFANLPDEGPERNRALEKLLRACVGVIEKNGGEMGLGDLSQNSEVAPLKPALKGASMIALFNVCYPDYFSLSKTDNNQTIINMLYAPPEGSLEPAELPVQQRKREKREREGDNRGNSMKAIRRN